MKNVIRKYFAMDRHADVSTASISVKRTQRYRNILYVITRIS